MQIKVRRFELHKTVPLTISRATRTGSANLLVTVEQDGIKGMGEMAPVSGGLIAETADMAQATLERWSSALTDTSPWEMQRIETQISVQDGERAAFCALDCAQHDWQGKSLGLPVWKLLGLDMQMVRPTSITIGINPPDVTRARVTEVLRSTGAKFLKIKLGSPQGIEADKAALTAAREAAHAFTQEAGLVPIGWRVDANGGWGLRDARQMLGWLAERGVAFVEQPLRPGQEADLAVLHKDAPILIFLDESIRIARDIPLLAEHTDGIVLKLMKCGGLREALRVAHTARAHDLKLMIGCMSESSLGITAAAQLSALADALDLDSHLNLDDDPFLGATYAKGTVMVSDAPGLGVRAAAVPLVP